MDNNKKISELDKDFSKKVTDRFLELCLNGKIFYSDELSFLNHLKKRYNPMTISDYSKLKNKNYKVVQDQVKSNKIAHIIFGNQIFILEKFE